MGLFQVKTAVKAAGPFKNILHPHTRRVKVGLAHAVELFLYPIVFTHRFAIDGDTAVRGKYPVGNNIDKRGFSRAVAPQQAIDSASLKAEGNALQRKGVAVTLGDVTDLNRVHLHTLFQSIE